MQTSEELYLKNLKNLLAEGKFKNVIQELRVFAENVSDDFENDVIHVSARFSRLEAENRRGLITRESYNIENNRINQTLLAIIDDVSIEKQLNASRNILKSTLSVPSNVDFEKIIGREELFDTNWLQKAITASKSICKVMNSSGESGTGFLLKGGYLLTNYHVFSMSEISNEEMKKRIDKTKAIFNYKIDENGNLEDTEEYTFDSSDFSCNTFNNLDYVLVKVNDPQNDLAKWGELKLEGFAEPKVEDKVNIIQHPDGDRMKIALPDKIISVWDKYLFYVADTKGGSSGSPVFNQDWNVVALHHAGINEKDWAGGMQINKEGKIAPSNRGILIKEIIQHVRENSSIEI